MTERGSTPAEGDEDAPAPRTSVDITTPDTREELLDRAARYAELVDLDVTLRDLEWEVSERAKRRAGSCRYDPATGRIAISLTWEAYRRFGWAEFTDTIRHELVHAWEFEHFGESGHGERFREKADEVDAPRHCRTFTRGRLELVCTDPDCDWRADRHRASRVVREPGERYRCGECGSRFLVRHVATGREWTTSEGYERAREAIGDDW